MKIYLAILFVSFAARAETPGLVGYSQLVNDELHLTWEAARDIYDFLTEAKETIDGNTTFRTGRDLQCMRFRDTDRLRTHCAFAFDKAANLTAAETKELPPDEAVRAFFSIWPKKTPQPLLKVKLTADIARLLVRDVAPLDGKRLVNKNKIRCGLYAGRHGKIGALTNIAPRCFVGFTPSGESVLAEELP